MIKHERIKIGKYHLEAVTLPLGGANLVIIKGRKGYVMCGYLNLKAAQALGDVAIKITGVSDIKDAIKAKVASLSVKAKKIGVYKNQPIKDVLKIIA